MTAEIGLMNRMAVALAADSAVTLGSMKVYNSANKLFMLSKYQPVGIMIYGNAELMSTPWETIIKVYRKNLYKNFFNTLEEYANDFINFLECRFFSEEELISNFEKTIKYYYYGILEETKGYINKVLDSANIEEGEIIKVLKENIAEHHKMLKRNNNCKNFDSNQIKEINKKYKVISNKVIRNFFDISNLKLTAVDIRRLNDIAIFLMTKEYFTPRHTGFVIAGFGEKEIYPSIISYKIEAVINNKAKYMYLDDISYSVGKDGDGAIIPFAQSDMAYAFMEGIDKRLEDFTFEYFDAMINKYSEMITDTVGTAKKLKKEEIIKELNKKVSNAFRESILKHRREKYVDPILDVLGGLPKDELATMAETLVNLTSFKRKITMDTETVGGPIDVAVISKGDGFIWIKRKHYFKSELNNHFFNIIF